MYKKLCLMTALIVLGTTSCAPNYYYECSTEPVITCINIIDQNGTSETISNTDRLQKYTCIDFFKPQPYQKVLRIFSRDECGNLPSIITSYHPNGLLHQYLEVENGRAKGNYQEWYSDGTQKIAATVIGGSADITPDAIESWLFDGINTAWDEEGNLQAELLYCKGELDGECLYYHRNGNIWKRVCFLRGKMNGLLEVFLENGELFQTLQYKLGEKNGCSQRFWCKEQLAAEEMYDCGRLISASYYNQCGKKIAEIINGDGFRAAFGKETITELTEYRNGFQEGEVQVFTMSGAIAQIYHVKNGVKHGEEYWYFEKLDTHNNRRPKLLLNWYEGKIQGLSKTWYTNGNQESQREMSNNARNGLSTAWYEDGNLMFIEEYEKDRLVKGEYYRKGDFIPVSQIREGNGTATLFEADGSFLRKTDYLRGHPDGFN